MVRAASHHLPEYMESQPQLSLRNDQGQARQDGALRDRSQRTGHSGRLKMPWKGTREI